MGKTPDLIVAGGYTRGRVRDGSSRKGFPIGNRKLNPMMSGVAKTRFTHLTLART